MATSFPTALDDLANPGATTGLDATGFEHHLQHANANDAIEALQAKVGVNDSTDLATLEGRIRAIAGGWGPEHHGLKAWAFDPAALASSFSPAGGVLHTVALQLPRATQISRLHLSCFAAGSGTTNAFAALYTSAGALLAQSANQASNFATNGAKVFPLTAAQQVAAGVVYGAFWFTATTTIPTLSRGTSNFTVNINLAAAASRFATTADTGLTTTAPATLGAKTANANAFWMAAD